MNQKTATAQALSVYIANRSLQVISRIYFGILTGLALLSLLLVINVSRWWWILLVLVVLIIAISALLQTVAKHIIRRIYRHPFSSTQHQALESFTQKLQQLIDAHGTSNTMLALISVWEIVRYKEPRTVRRIIDDSLSLSTDYHNLEKHFGNAA